MPFLAAAAVPAMQQFATSQVADAITGGSKPTTANQQSINGLLDLLKPKASKPADPNEPGDVPDIVEPDAN